MACLESLETMPAIPEDVEQALEEGITILPSWGPHRVVEQDGKLTGMELVRCTAVFDKDGRFAPAFDAAVKTVVEADQILVAIGQAADLSYAGPALQTERGLLATDKMTGATSLDRCVCGRRRHRRSRDDGAGDGLGAKGGGIHRRVLDRRQVRRLAPASRAKSPSSSTKRRCRPAHGPTPRLPVPQRTLLGEDSATLTPDALAQEATRCANCGCVAVSASDLAPALIALDAQVKTTQRTLAIGDLFAAAESKTTVLGPDELIEEIEIPAPPPGRASATTSSASATPSTSPSSASPSARRWMDGQFHDARVVLGAVAPVPLRAHAVEALLEGQAPSEALADEAARLAVADTQPLARNRAKVEMVKALVRKAILTNPI